MSRERLDEIEGRAKAVADEPRCTDCGREVILHDMLCGDCGVDAICRDAGDDVPMRERHVSARYVDDVAWLVAQVRERDAEIARLRAELATVTGALRDPRMPAGLARNIADLRALSDGWLDGGGEAPDGETLDWLEKTLPRWVVGGMPVPLLFPTEDGFVRAEWPVGADGIDASAEFHACVVRAPMKEAPDA